MKKSSLALAALMSLAPAAASAKQSQEPVRVGGDVQAPARITYVAPVYPAVAESARVTGVVILEAVVGPSGQVTDATVLKSIPLLDQAAIDAVKQWRYTPTTLNGQPVPVIMTVTVNFTTDGTVAQPALNGAPIGMDAVSSNSLATEWRGAPPIRVGASIAPPARVKYVTPVYPADAQQANVTGIVVIEAIIDETGNVAMTRVLKSVPLLDDAAVAAVKQWKYTPTLLNGVAVPVAMTVTVNFTLQTR